MAPAEPALDRRARGDAIEAAALGFLQQHGLRLLARNARSRGGEIDLVMRERDGTLVFVEVRSRGASGFGGAAASIGASKRGRIVLAARHYLLRWPAPPPCRFDVVAIDGERLQWLQAAFDAG